ASTLAATHSTPNQNLYSTPLRTARGKATYSAPKPPHVADQKDRHYKKFRIGTAQNGYGRGNNDRSCECYRGRGNTGQYKRPATQYAGAKASDNNLFAWRCIGEEQKR